MVDLGVVTAVAQVERCLGKLREAIAAADWMAASVQTDRLRLVHGWTYARFVSVFGERWEEYSEEMEEADSQG